MFLTENNSRQHLIVRQWSVDAQRGNAMLLCDPSGGD